MAKQRYINTRFWSDNFVSELNPLDRYLFLYFLTNEHTNICGIYEVPLKTISFETGIQLDMLKKMLVRLKGKVYYVNGWVYIKNFAKHQAINESIVKGIEAAKKDIPAEIMSKINEIEQGVDRVSTDSPHDPTYLNLNSNTNTNSNINSEQGSQVNKLIDLFKDVNPSYSKLFSNKTQRSACERLLKSQTFEQLQKIISFLPKSNLTKYMPVVTTPVQLEDKMGQLASSWQKLKNDNPIIL